ncbi:oxidoreductase [Mycolicibacterium sp. XJ2546]
MSWTAADLPSFAGRTVIVTGANSGLGLVTARELARVGAKTILAVRNTAKGDEAAASMTGTGFGPVEVRKLDLQDLASVREFADGFSGPGDGVDVLVNNAGIMAVPYALTVDGFESQIGTNHLGHFALTNLLLPKIRERVVTVSSIMHFIGRISLKDLNWKARPYLAWPAYGQSKLANLLFTMELQRRLDAAGSAVKSLAAHPGYSATNLQGRTGNPIGTPVWLAANRLFATEPDFGARQTLYAVSEDLPGDTFVGPRFGSRGPSGPTSYRSPLARSAKTAGALWELSEQLTDTKFSL